mmetsp:Transcript_34524/g.64424  ORF Transcript_34524/g.64424 Transcript_34524/m.64424 type:complete len:1231 (-) Transcript_34524:65-3757(-)
MLLWGGKLVWDAKDGQNDSASTTSGPTTPLSSSPGKRTSERHGADENSSSPRKRSSESAQQVAYAAPGTPQSSHRQKEGGQRSVPPSLATLLGSVCELSPKQLHYVQTVLEPTIIPLLLEVVNAMPEKLGAFLLNWLVAHLHVPRSISNPILSWLKAPPVDLVLPTPRPPTCDREQQTDSEAVPEATPERVHENCWLASSEETSAQGRETAGQSVARRRPSAGSSRDDEPPYGSSHESQDARYQSEQTDEADEDEDAFDDSRVCLNKASCTETNSILKRKSVADGASLPSQLPDQDQGHPCPHQGQNGQHHAPEGLERIHRRVSIRKTPGMFEHMNVVGELTTAQNRKSLEQAMPDMPKLALNATVAEPISTSAPSTARMSQGALKTPEAPSSAPGRRVSMAVDVTKDPDGKPGGGRNSQLSRKSSLKVGGRSRAISIVEPAPEVPHLGIVELIKQNQLFEQLDDDEMHLLARAAQVKSFDPDEEVIGHGDKVEQLHMIWSGEGRVCVPKQVGLLKKGDSFGEHALSKRHLTSTTSVSAHTGDSRLVTIAVTYKDLQSLGLARKLRRAWNMSSKGQRCVKRTGTHSGQSQTKSKRNSALSREDSKKTIKSPEDQKMMYEAIRSNTHLMDWLQLSDKQVETMIYFMKQEVAEVNQEVTKKGEKGDTFYIVHDGMLEVDTGVKRQTDTFHSTHFRSSDSFGELALLYNTPRKATVRALRRTTLWVLTRAQFCMVMKLKSDVRVKEYERLIDSVSLLSERLSSEEKEMLADTLEEVFFVKGEEVVRQGDEGDTFFVIFEGECEVKVNGKHQGFLTKGSYFGERALLSREPRAATVVVTSETATLLTLDGSSFELLVGHALEDHVHPSQKRNSQQEHAVDGEGGGTYNVLKHRSSIDLIRQMVQKQGLVTQRKEVPRENLEFVGVLGHGSFASVTLQRDIDSGKLYALKAISKGYIKKEKLNNMVLNEKRTMMMLDSDFTIRLHCTYNCPQFLYFLLEPCFGGELFEVYSHHEEFFGADTHAKFYTICCSLGLEHLHARRIIYRDLKLENVLLHSNGYALLTDLGLAKVVIGKTYTVCGTADYFAPETLKRIGHNRAVDWWALGVMVFVMLTGRSPFDAEDVMQIYKNIVKGFKKETFPSDMAPDQVEVIKGLCRKKPEERIPMSANGMKDLEQHIFFVSSPKIPWDAVRHRTWQAPYSPPEMDMDEIASRTNPQDVPYLNSGDESEGSWDDDF